MISSVKRIREQTPIEKMYLLRQVSHYMLGPKWKYFGKIKAGDTGLAILKKQNLAEQMKATRSALKFTSKSAKKAYRSVYQSCIKDICSNTGQKKDEFPLLPEVESGQDLPSLTSSFDNVLISWTPVKFFLPTKQIREKGAATQRHTEGLIAKLFFKVVAYYSVSENWDTQKLTFYLRKIDKDASYQDVALILEPLKKDLMSFVEAFEPFKFGKASLAKDVSQDGDSFDDAMAVESFESQVQTLYWYNFIYLATELFIFRYAITLIISTNSLQAIRYLAGIFDPVFEKIIENKNIFLGSFETDRSKKMFIKPFEKYKLDRKNDPFTSKIKTQKGVFETYVYNLELLEKSTLSFELAALPKKDSEWADFIRFKILGLAPPIKNVDSLPAAPVDKREIEQISQETREHAFMQIMAIMIKCSEYRRLARHKILDRFKKRVVSDKELAEKRIAELKKQGEKKVRILERKAAKIRRMKQDDATKVFEKDVENFKQKIKDRCESIQKNAMMELGIQKKRLQELFRDISREDSINTGLPANILYKLADEVDESGKFTTDFLNSSTKSIQTGYSKELEPFYENIFNIIEPSIQEKVVIIQSLKKSGAVNALSLSLNPEEEQEFEDMINGLKAKIEESLPGAFKGKLIFLSVLIPMDNLFSISIDNLSLKTLLRLKIMLPKGGKPENVPSAAAKAILVLNMVKNPVPRNSIIMEGRENERDPQKAINTALLNKLLAETE
ncbi:hypothetical protein KKA14_21085 [bacterium]|nr:hypothetical protein [bacterium]